MKTISALVLLSASMAHAADPKPSAAANSTGDAAGETTRSVDAASPTPAWTAPTAWTGSAAAGAMTGWPEIRPEARAGSYWWWPASAVTREDLTWNLETYQQAGWGNMGVIGIYGVKGEEQRSIPIFTPDWFAMFNHTVTEARRLGMNIDLTPSSGWRMGGPHITEDHAERSFAVKDGRIESLLNRAQVKRAGPGGMGPAFNPYSPAAVKFHFDWLAERFREGGGLAPRAFYYDSFENPGNWAAELPGRFHTWRGYDIHDHAAALAGQGDPEEARRVLSDYRETLSQLLIECVSWINGWCAERGSGLRMQAHGSPANLLDMYAAATIPETEVFGAGQFDIPGFRREPQWCAKDPQSELVIRFASSAAHVAGHPLVVSESFTWLREHFHTALSHIKPEMDRLLLAGINGIYYHGTCFTPKVAGWPGWLFYASTQANARNSIFRDIPALNAYLTRCQSVLQQGSPHNDILLYWPVHDLWMSGGKNELRFTVHHPQWIDESTCGEAARWLLQRGHTFDLVSDAQLARTGWQNGRLVTSGGSAYQTILVPDAGFMPVESARQLVDLARAGATVIVWRRLPGDVPGWHDHAARRKQLADLFGGLSFADGTASVGDGKILLGDDLARLLQNAAVARETMVDQGLRFIRRKLPGEVAYFIANHSASAVDAWVPLAASCQSAILMNPMTGAIGQARIRHQGPQAEVHLQLLPGESRILRATEHGKSDAAPWPTHRPAGDPVVVTGPWKLEFIEGGPILPAPATFASPASWTTLDDPDARRFAGAARYSTTFNLPESTSATRWHLDLGDVRESARVRVNGRPAGIVVAHPFRIELGDLLRPGENTLAIEVTNLSANRIRDLDRRGVPWKKFHDINIVSINYKPFDASAWPLTPSGLNGPVTLIPVTTGP
jgi:hypothetical protein